MTELGTVKRFWSNHVNNEYYTQKERGTEEYFKDIEQKRYRHHYHLKDLFLHFSQNDKYHSATMLEIGCGIGIDSVQLAKSGFTLTAVDLTEVAIDIAKQRAEKLRLKIDYKVSNAESLDFESERFDYVYSFGVLHHTPNINSAIDEVYRVLKPGGQAYVMLYAKYSLVNLIHRLFNIPYESPTNIKDHCPIVYTFSVKDISLMFQRFSSVIVIKEYPFTYGFRRLTDRMPEPIIRFLGRYVGWHLMIKATK